MQVTTVAFQARAAGSLRPISGKVFISFSKAFDENIEFFTLDESMLDSGDILQGENDVINEWDKYDYSDYSSRLIDMEWTRQEDPISSVALATADIVFDNHDDYFTPGAGSPVQDYILPGRPVRLYSGFKDEDIPVFIGLTEGMPEVDEASKTITFHCIDFTQSLFNRPLEETPLYIDARTDEILSDLFTIAGLLPGQLSLDLGVNIVKYASFPKGTKLGDAVKELMVAEQGRVFMTEEGVITFKNRQNYPITPVLYLDGSNILEADTIRFDEIVNVVEIDARVRAPQAFQKGWELPESKAVLPGETLDIWANFADPVLDCDVPLYVDIATTSYYATNQNAEGTGLPLNADITLLSTALFSDSFKMTFENTGSNIVYVTNIVLYATPVTVTNTIFVREEDADSIEKYDEHVVRLTNDFIQTSLDARSRAIILLEDYKDYNRAKSLTIKGNPALQVSDMVGVSLQSNEDYIVTKITGQLRDASFKQRIEVKQFNRHEYFVLDESSLDSGKELAP